MASAQVYDFLYPLFVLTTSSLERCLSHGADTVPSGTLGIAHYMLLAASGCVPRGRWLLLFSAVYPVPAYGIHFAFIVLLLSIIELLHTI